MKYIIDIPDNDTNGMVKKLCDLVGKDNVHPSHLPGSPVAQSNKQTIQTLPDHIEPSNILERKYRTDLQRILLRILFERGEKKDNILRLRLADGIEDDYSKEIIYWLATKTSFNIKNPVEMMPKEVFIIKEYVFLGSPGTIIYSIPDVYYMEDGNNIISSISTLINDEQEANPSIREPKEYDAPDSIGAIIVSLEQERKDKNISTRCYTCLRSCADGSHYNPMWQIIRHGRKGVKGFKNLGAKTLEEIDDLLFSRGLSWDSCTEYLKVCHLID